MCCDQLRLCACSVDILKLTYKQGGALPLRVTKTIHVLNFASELYVGWAMYRN